MLIVMAAATAQAADGQVEFTGVINDNPCTINSESVKKSVDMGQVRIMTSPALLALQPAPLRSPSLWRTRPT